VSIVPSGGRADDELVAPGTVLRQGALLAADPAGTIDFKLDSKIQRCQSRPASQVRLTAAGDVLLEFVRGTVWCGTTDEGGVVSFAVGGDVLRVDDPVFSVSLDEAGAIEVRVVQGFVQVAGGPTLGEGQRGNRSAPGAAWTVGPFGLGELPSDGENDEGPVARRLLDEVLATLPPLRYPRLTAEQSPTVGAFAALGSMPVVVVDTGDASAVAFATNLFGGLVSPLWDLPVEVSAAAEEEARARLEAGEVGLVITSAGGDGVPLFEDGQGQVWRAVDAGDPELRRALQGAVVTALQASCEFGDSGEAARSAPDQSCYEQIYASSIGVIPVPLSVFAPFLGLG
jgi:hypothetical protein